MAFNALAEPQNAAASNTDKLHIRPLNVENGTDRFSYSDNDIPPNALAFRNNLIALSQRRNLVFVGCNSQVYVWEPVGSSQTLGKKPAMIINPVAKCPDSMGYITPHFPHSINNMLVGDLGLEEVLVLVSDSGNVCGYRVEAVFSALQRAEQANLERPIGDADLTPFLVENVESSAWGLAIHKYARQIAVSANTGLITVFAFALAGPEPGDEPDSNNPVADSSLEDNDDDQTWIIADTGPKFAQMREEMRHIYRTQNVMMTYPGHFTNIPSVSFLNCDLDPNGKWMFSTDIDNKLIVWNVWESRSPVNVFHFNNTPSYTVPEVFGFDDRGWAVLALDPRIFRRCKTAEEAIGGPPEYQKRKGKRFLNTTRLTKRIQDASPLYNHFPPAVRSEAEQSVLPDIFSHDSRSTSPSDTEAITSNLSNNHHQRQDDAKSQAVDEDADNVNASVTAAGDAHTPHSTDAFSHSAVDGSVQEANASQEISPDADTGTETGQAGGQSAEDTTGVGPVASFEDLIMQLGDLPQPPNQGPLTTAEFLQQALIDGLGGGQYIDVSMGDDYLISLGNDDDMDDDDDDDDQESDEDEDSWGDHNNLRSPGHYVGPTRETAAYNAFDRMFRSAFPDDPDPYGFTETLITDTQPAASDRFDFSLLHFSQTDIRLIPSPRSLNPTVVCYAPLRQEFTEVLENMRAIDRFNMVQYIPEHGIVVAASQKGRALIISLTESEATGPAFRLDWIIPFESQEKYGERPLKPLLGMGVSPMPGFEMPPDVSSIPSADDIRDLGFHYQLLRQDSDKSSADTPFDQNGDSDPSIETTTNQSPDKTSPPTVPDTAASSSKEETSKLPLTHAERHAWASRHHGPEESWRGWNPSRRYRLMLMYLDHSVLNYEFWYESKTADEESDTPGGGDGDGGDAMNEYPYLMV